MSNPHAIEQNDLRFEQPVTNLDAPRPAPKWLCEKAN
jgi:hypothetical protein